MQIIEIDTFDKKIVQVQVGENVNFGCFVNAYGCIIDSESIIGDFVEIQKEAIIGKKCRISAFSFICTGVEIGDNCFIGPHVVFVNDKYPRSVNEFGIMEPEKEWSLRLEKTKIGNNVIIGSNSTILCGLEIGEGSIIKAGSVVTKNIGPGEIWSGNPAVKAEK